MLKLNKMKKSIFSTFKVTAPKSAAPKSGNCGGNGGKCGH